MGVRLSMSKTGAFWENADADCFRVLHNRQGTTSTSGYRISTPQALNDYLSFDLINQENQPERLSGVLDTAQRFNVTATAVEDPTCDFL